MKKLSLSLDTLQVQSFETAALETSRPGTVRGFARPTDLQDTNCSAVDRCNSARGCTILRCPVV